MNGCVITRVAPGAPGCVDEGFFHSEILNILHIVAFQMISTPPNNVLQCSFHPILWQAANYSH